MKKSIVFLFSLVAVFSFRAQTVAAEEVDAIYVWVDGASTCYRLTDMPQVTYEGSIAVLSIKGTEQLRLDLGEQHLVITYGVYQQTPTDIEQTGQGAQTNTPVQQVGKYIRGGQLIIVCDGVRYDIHGRRLPLIPNL